MRTKWWCHAEAARPLASKKIDVSLLLDVLCSNERHNLSKRPDFGKGFHPPFIQFPLLAAGAMAAHSGIM